MTQVKWFRGIKTEEDAKLRWQQLYKKHHPDLPTGDAVKMQEINAEYQSLISAFVWKQEWGQHKKEKQKAKKKQVKKKPLTTAVKVEQVPGSRLHKDDVDALVETGIEIGEKLLHLSARLIKRRMGK